jgi:hypothetical protein
MVKYTEAKKRKRSLWIWAFSIFFFISAGWTLLSLLLIRVGIIGLNPAQQAYFDKLTYFDHGLTLLMALCNFIGAIALLLLRRIARYLFLIALVGNFLLVIWHTFTKGWLAAIGGTGLIGAVIGWGLLITICLYSWKLSRSGVLR